MSKLFVTSDDHFRFVQSCVASRPNKVMIATYNLYAGITATGKDMTTFGHAHQSQSRDLLEMVKTKDRSVDVRIMVGTYDYRSCKPPGNPCLDCEKKYMMGLFKIQNHFDKFREFDIRVSTKSHAKFMIFGYGNGEMRGVAGGRNFADSIWEEATFGLEDTHIADLSKRFEDAWQTSRRPDNDWINTVIAEQDISKAAITSLDNEAV